MLGPKFAGGVIFPFKKKKKKKKGAEAIKHDRKVYNIKRREHKDILYLCQNYCILGPKLTGGVMDLHFPGGGPSFSCMSDSNVTAQSL